MEALNIIIDSLANIFPELDAVKESLRSTLKTSLIKERNQKNLLKAIWLSADRTNAHCFQHLHIDVNLR